MGEKRAKIEVVLILPEGIGLSSLIAAIADALKNLPGGDKIKVEKLIYE